ncbi:hypothetical protein A3D77_04675 [Candidatus Gottesmanbacteria bacterium RIFCSPHIGHO2_02_FULL_39_11]|uniref:Glycosyltransferase 2-like domain-containing protein n=1 Tax=Candidatus Gottesmanbacteria bacterium RIFCSPHIGHO2_02_FULL_39_11 TaxID=1798382 RepID=A0A1F5ZJV2_9BACT|nr:MAG: hypothetical protein A3D77_04675 [Candidatus Gottesmanbacteria bacterium RIFCSPHIGHO2_02_FULL_39_11]
MQKKLVNNISLIVLAKNEEINIKSCLESLKWVGDIIVVDTGSTDGTMEVAKRYTDKVYSFPFNGSFAEVRNFGLSKVKSDWVLVLDADETLPADAQEKINKLITSDEYDGYWFARRNYINEKKYLKYGYFYPDFQLRLFKNTSNVSYCGKIHECLTIPKEKTKEVKDIEIFHNFSHTKYDSFFHFSRFYSYIRIEGKEISRSNASDFYILKESITLPLVHIWKSFIQKYGYKDGYAGLRAAVLWGMYESTRYLYALYVRIRKI